MVCVSEISSENYIIKLFNPDGSQIGTIEREFTPVPKTPQEIQDETELITTILRERGVPEEAIQFEADSNKWMIQPQGLRVDGQAEYGFKAD